MIDQNKFVHLRAQIVERFGNPEKGPVDVLKIMERVEDTSLTVAILVKQMQNLVAIDISMMRALYERELEEQ